MRLTFDSRNHRTKLNKYTLGSNTTTCDKPDMIVAFAIGKLTFLFSCIIHKSIVTECYPIII